MPDANPRRRGLCSVVAVQRAVMALTLATHPHWSTMRELRREIGCGGVVHHAVRELIEIGLIERRGGSIRPTRTAARLEQLKLP